MHRFLCQVILLAAACAAAGERADPVETGFDRQAMDTAIAKAKETRALFNATLAKALSTKSTDSFAVKHGFETKSGGREHCWISFVRIDGADYVGRLDNVPQNLAKPLKAGDPVRIPQTEISDWMIRRGEKVYGGFTIQVLLKSTQDGPKIEFGNLADLK